MSAGPGRWRWLLGSLGGLLLVPWLSHCRPLEPPRRTVAPGRSSEDTSSPPACEREVTSLESIARVDWAALFKVEARVGAQIRDGLQVARELPDLAAEIEGELRTACNGLVRELGGSERKDARGACEAAFEALDRTRAEIGPDSSIEVTVEPSRCDASMEDMAACASACDGRSEGGQVEVRCEGGEVAGKCNGACEGRCELTAGGRCEGECRGLCDGAMKGACLGRCENGCEDRRPSCLGLTCDSKCQGPMQGICQSECKGSCQLKAGGSCPGVCLGTCSSAKKEPRCSGKLAPQGIRAACEIACGARLLAQVACSSAQVRLRTMESRSALAQSRLERAVEANLGALLAVSVGRRGQLLDVADRGEAIVVGAQQSAAAATREARDERIARCLAASFPAALEAARSVRASVRLATEVAASASNTGPVLAP